MTTQRPTVKRKQKQCIWYTSQKKKAKTKTSDVATQRPTEVVNNDEKLDRFQVKKKRCSLRSVAAF